MDSPVVHATLEMPFCLEKLKKVYITAGPDFGTT
jgi:hypothetical protein